ncbi:hypothetical protein LWI28_027924 [Acer negundo]|uniref:Uncharacterized protein n=1 Tax=Acer negundo TaxID=4023 RepID=A0AAD5IHV4_ACENE|nr:hypothetical protein LWI28_027924 [Acer negundo]
MTRVIANLETLNLPTQNPRMSGDEEESDEESDEEESDPSLFYDEACLSEEDFVDLDLPPVFDEDIFDKKSMSAYLDLPPVFDEEIIDKESMSADFDLPLVFIKEIFEKDLLSIYVTEGIAEIRYRDTLAEYKRFFPEEKIRYWKFAVKRKKSITKIEACKALLQVKFGDKQDHIKGDKSQSVLFYGYRLAKQLQDLETQIDWNREKNEK